jgi:hypothetical protein
VTSGPLDGRGSAADPHGAAAQLAALQADRAVVADRAMQPWWYDAALGLLVFQLIASYSLHRNWVTVLALLVLGLATAAFFSSYAFWFPWLPIVALVLYAGVARWLMAQYQRITGFWVRGDRPGPTRRAIRTWQVLAALVLVPGMLLELVFDVHGAMVVAGVVLGIGIAVVSRWWSRIYVAELRGRL